MNTIKPNMAQSYEALLGAVKDRREQRNAARAKLRSLQDEQATLQEWVTPREKIVETLRDLEAQIKTQEEQNASAVAKIQTECDATIAREVQDYVHPCVQRVTVTVEGMVLDLTDLRAAVAARNPLPTRAILVVEGRTSNTTQTVNLLDPPPSTSSAPVSDTSTAPVRLVASGVAWDVTAYMSLMGLFNRTVVLTLGINGDPTASVTLSRANALALPSAKDLCTG